MNPSSWSHGYYPDALYTCGFYGEMAPSWLDFVALIKGHRPRRREGESFAYLELGSGMGFHLAQLAAAYPEGQFVGVDFHADQIAHSRQLVEQLELVNIRFIHGDFITLAEGGSDSMAKELQPIHDAARDSVKGNKFDYVVSHGVYSWVAEPVRAALLQIASQALAIGGLFYCSYNTLPGWYPGAIFQHLAEVQRSRSDPRDPLGTYQRTAQVLRALSDPQAEQPTPLARAFPSLAATVDQAVSSDARYLLHEYANASWEPLWVDAVHPRMGAHQLRFLGSATLPELFPDLLPTAIRAAAGSDLPQGTDELVLDIATNKRFRRDVFVHGFQPLSARDLTEQMSGCRIAAQRPAPQAPSRYATSFGDIQPDPTGLMRVHARLAEGPASLKTIASEIDASLYDAATLAALMLQAGQVGLQRPPDAGAAEAVRVNRRLLQLISSGAPYGHLVAPSLGTAIAVPLMEAVLLEGQLNGLDPEAQARYLAATLAELGQGLHARDAAGAPGGASATDTAGAGETLTLARTAVAHFRAEGVKPYQRCGVIPAAPG